MRTGAEEAVGAISDLRMRYLAPFALWMAAVVLITLVEGTPDRLPPVALGSTILLHAVRAGALFALGLVVATVIARGGAGRLPTQLSTTGIGYDADEMTETTAGLIELQQQVDRLQAVVDNLAADVDTGPRST